MCGISVNIESTDALSDGNDASDIGSTNVRFNKALWYIGTTTLIITDFNR
jgi:hypothetical protein